MNHTADERQVLDLAVRAGRILLENGAEISRVEETIDRIFAHFQIRSASAFVLSNGIFITIGSDREPFYARVQHIPVKSVHLHRIAQVNELSRALEQGQLTLKKAQARLEKIEKSPGKTRGMQVLASGAGSGAFCCLFGGCPADIFCSFLTGLLLYYFVLTVNSRYLSKITGSIAGGALVTVSCLLFFRLGAGCHLDHMIIGSVMPLIPGVPFVNGIRDMADGDYISGFVRLLDAVLIFFCIAGGVGLIFSLYHKLTGGVLL